MIFCSCTFGSKHYGFFVIFHFSLSVQNVSRNPRPSTNKNNNALLDHSYLKRFEFVYAFKWFKNHKKSRIWKELIERDFDLLPRMLDVPSTFDMMKYSLSVKIHACLESCIGFFSNEICFLRWKKKNVFIENLLQWSIVMHSNHDNRSSIKLNGLFNHMIHSSGQELRQKWHRCSASTPFRLIFPLTWKKRIFLSGKQMRIPAGKRNV